MSFQARCWKCYISADISVANSKKEETDDDEFEEPGGSSKDSKSIILYPPTSDSRTDTMKFEMINSDSRHSSGVGVVNSGDSIHDESLYVLVARNSLEKHLMSKQIPTAHPGQYRVKDFKMFFSTLAEEMCDNIAHETLRKNDGSRRNRSISNQTSSPHSIGDIDSWVGVHNESKQEWLTLLLRYEHISITDMRVYGVTPRMLFDSGIMLRELVTRNNYTISELCRLNITWNGFILLGLALNDFDEKIGYCLVSNFISEFTYLTIIDFLKLEPYNLSIPEKLELFLSFQLSRQDLVALQFQIPNFQKIMSQRCFSLLLERFNISFLIEIGLNRTIMKSHGLLKRSFFNQVNLSIDTYIIQLAGGAIDVLDDTPVLPSNTISMRDMFETPILHYPPETHRQQEESISRHSTIQQQKKPKKQTDGVVVGRRTYPNVRRATSDKSDFP